MTTAQAPPRFLVDAHMGRLAGRLRMLGYDALLARSEDDDTLIRRALREDRILLTRDLPLATRRVATRGPLRALYLRGDSPREQLAQVVKALALSTHAEFDRCLECNVLLEHRTKDQVAGRVPPYVFATQERFRECPSCRRLFWRGTHWRRMRQELASTFRKAQSPPRADRGGRPLGES